MAVEKQMSPAELEMAGTGEVEVEVVNPDAVGISVEGESMVIDFTGEMAEEIMGPEHDGNLAEFIEDADLQATVEDLNGATKINSGLFGDFFSQGIVDTFNKTAELEDRLEDSISGWTYNIGGNRGDHFEQILKMIESASERGVNREAFVVEFGGFDAHGGVLANLQDRFPTVDSAIDGFYNRLTQNGMGDQVTTIVISEFGRTSTPNTNHGSDHGEFCHSVIWL